jgi:hypothetical protein
MQSMSSRRQQCGCCNMSLRQQSFLERERERDRERENVLISYTPQSFLAKGRNPRPLQLDVVPVPDKSEEETAPTLGGQSESCAGVAYGWQQTTPSPFILPEDVAGSSYPILRTLWHPLAIMQSEGWGSTERFSLFCIVRICLGSGNRTYSAPSTHIHRHLDLHIHTIGHGFRQACAAMYEHA